MNHDDCIQGGNACPKINTCSTPCLYLNLLRKLSGVKNKPLRECLSPPEGMEERDYKVSLIEQQEHKAKIVNITIKEIREIPQERLRAIAALLYADIPRIYICDLFDISPRHLRRICNE